MDFSIKFKDINDFNENAVELGNFIKNRPTSKLNSYYLDDIRYFVASEFIFPMLKNLKLNYKNAINFYAKYTSLFDDGDKIKLEDFCMGDPDLELIMDAAKHLAFNYIMGYLTRGFKLNKITILKILSSSLK